ncbi:MAG TPA: GNAT family N-acetyltransferase [Bacillota bacterium]|nr:GNAT family N-acetyltransferase [Bacillota bacterium]
MVLETARLLLRPLEARDLDGLIQIFSDPVAMRHYPSTKTREEGAAWLLWCQGLAPVGLHAAVLKADGAFVGQCGLVPQTVDGKDELEIGYLLLQAHWGKGLATEAAMAWRDHGFSLGRNRLISLIDPANTPSIRVAERVGMTLDHETAKWGKRLLVYAIAQEP